MPGAARVAADAVDWWSRETQLVPGLPFSADEVRRQAIDAILISGSRARAEEKDEDRIGAWLATAGVTALAEAQSCCFDRLLAERLANLQERSREGGWSAERRDDELGRLLLLWGASGVVEGAAEAQAYLGGELLLGARNGALQAARTSPAGQIAFPYHVYRSGHRPHSRARHAILDGFVYRTGHPLAPLFEPPNGWGCQCVAEPVDYLTAQSLGWSGDFPLGEAKLVGFLGAGAHDDNFPKGVVMRGMPASLVGC